MDFLYGNRMPYKSVCFHIYLEFVFFITVLWHFFLQLIILFLFFLIKKCIIATKIKCASKQYMKTSSGFVLIDKSGRILGCHATGKPNDYGYDFPKWHVEPDETHFEAALRELKEETNLTIEELDGVSDYIIDCGVYPHTKKKNIHLYIYPLNEFPDLNKLKCTTYFTTKDGNNILEMDGYKIISKDERKMFNRALWDKFDLIDDLNSRVEYDIV